MDADPVNWTILMESVVTVRNMLGVLERDSYFQGYYMAAISPFFMLDVTKCTTITEDIVSSFVVGPCTPTVIEVGELVQKQ